MTKELYTKTDRERSIINNTKGVIYVHEQPNANKYARSNTENYSNSGNFSGGKVAIELLKEINNKIELESKRQGVDANLVKAIVYTEVSHGGFYGYFAQGINYANSLYPMNIQNMWLPLGKNGANLNNTDDNIQIGITLIKRIKDRIEDPTIEKIATLYNSLAKDEVSDYGARVGEIYRTQPWKKYIKSEVEIEQSNPILQWKPTPVTVAKNDERYENIKNMASFALEGKFEALSEDLQHKIITTYISQKNQEYADAISKKNNSDYVREPNNKLSYLDQASTEKNQKNELGFSQASVDKHNEENSIALSQNQSQGRRLG